MGLSVKVPFGPNWLIVLADAVLSSMVLRAYAALVALFIRMEFRSDFEFDVHRPK